MMKLPDIQQKLNLYHMQFFWLKGTFSLHFLPILAQNKDFCIFAFFASSGGIESVKSEKFPKKTFVFTLEPIGNRF